VKDREFEKHDTAALAYLNDQHISNQRTVILYLAKKIGVNILSGRSIMNVSLPIRIFEPRSFLEKTANDFSNTPYFLEKAQACSDPLQRFKWISTWQVATLHLEPQMMKPFNPILGETFQGSFGNYEVILEQISHHPPISAFQIWNASDESAPKVEGHFVFEASTGIRKMTGYKGGDMKITFPDSG